VEKELTRRTDDVARQRQELPWVRVDKIYQFGTDEGNASLTDLFRGRSQLLVYHLMFGPDYKAGCLCCSAIADGFNGITTRLAHHEVMLWAVSRAQLPKLQAYKERMVGRFLGRRPSAVTSTSISALNSRRDDPVMNVGRGAMTNPVSTGNAGMPGTDLSTYLREREGVSAFAVEDGVIYHTYSAYARGVDAIWSMYPWLDRAPNGRNETGPWLRRHDEYETKRAAL
jgi:predicted dithiol-disulfide oxidoreductase (DUF899 family)